MKRFLLTLLSLAAVVGVAAVWATGESSAPVAAPLSGVIPPSQPMVFITLSEGTTASESVVGSSALTALPPVEGVSSLPEGQAVLARDVFSAPTVAALHGGASGADLLAYAGIGLMAVAVFRLLGGRKL